ncbi:MAG TPA: protein kinase [Candidatus Bathyarchaeia archaeon]|nr:protein kinase [Candidatus Bathyarchaeia archaeon]
MGSKKTQPVLVKSPHHNILVKPSFIGPTLVTVSSIPIAFLFALGVGWSLVYIFSIISLGILTAVDVRKSITKTALAGIVTLLAVSYTIANTDLGGRLPSTSGQWSWLFVAIPPAIAVIVSSIFFYARKQRFKIPLQCLIGTSATGLGLVLGTSVGTNLSAVLSVFLSVAFFVGIGLAANSIQTGILFVMEKFWIMRKLSMNMMPTMFFSLNAIIGYAYFVTPSPDREYMFISSLAYVPLLCIVAVLIGKLSILRPPPTVTASKPTPAGKSLPTVQPRIIVSGEHSLRQGQLETLKINTEIAGQAKEVGPITATVQFPDGKRQVLHLTHVSSGQYKASFQPGKPGNYSVKIGIGNKHYQTVHESFLFTVQPVQRLPQTVPVPVHATPPPPPLPKITAPPAPPKILPRTGLPSLDSWDPRVWLGQEIHGYTVKEHIATGASGYVLRATFGQAGTEMTLKIPILKTSLGSTALEETMSEATRLLELSGQSKYVVQIRGMLVDRLNVQAIVKGDTSLYYHSPPAIVMEYMRGGTAKRLVEDPDYEPLYYSEKWGVIVIVIGQMISTALDMIHQAGFVHLDVKPQNILFNSKPPLTGPEMLDQMISGGLVPKLADLGSAVRTGGKVAQFTSEYAPAEQVLGEGADASMDVYALGASMYTMLTRTPVHSPDLINAMNKVTTDPGTLNHLESIWKYSEPDFTKVDSKSSAVVTILKKMLERDPNHRPEAGEVANSLAKLVKR